MLQSNLPRKQHGRTKHSKQTLPATTVGLPQPEIPTCSCHPPPQVGHSWWELAIPDAARMLKEQQAMVWKPWIEGQLLLPCTIGTSWHKCCGYPALASKPILPISLTNWKPHWIEHNKQSPSFSKTMKDQSSESWCSRILTRFRLCINLLTSMLKPWFTHVAPPSHGAVVPPSCPNHHPWCCYKYPSQPKSWRGKENPKKEDSHATAGQRDLDQNV